MAATLRRALLLFLTIGCVTPSAYAQTGSITIELRDSGGLLFPIAPGESAVNIECHTEDYSSTKNGQITAGDSSHTFTVDADRTYYCEAMTNGTGYTRGGYKQNSLPPTSVANGQAKTLIVTYTALQQNLTVNLVDRNGAAYVTTSGSFSCLGKPNVSKSFASGSSSATVPVGDGNLECSLNISGTMAVPSTIYSTITATQDETIEFSVYPTDASLTVSVVDENLNPVVMTPSQRARVTCTGNIGGERVDFGGTIASGQSSKTFGVVGGFTYSCNVSAVKAFRQQTASVLVGVGETKTLQVGVLAKTSPMTVQLVNPQGTPVAVPVGNGDVSVSCSDRGSISGGGSGTIAEGDSEATFLVSQGLVTCSLPGVSGYYVRPDYGKSVFTSPSTTALYQFVVEPLNSSIVVHFVDQEGNPISVPAQSPDAWVRCIGPRGDPWASPSEGDSSATFTVVGGDTYRCQVSGFNGYMNGAASIAVGDGETKTVNVSLTRLDATLNVNVLDTDGNPLNVESGLGGIITAPSNRLFQFFFDIPAFASSTTAKVVGGKTYEVSGEINELTSTNVGTVTVPSNGTASTTLNITTPSAGTATFRLVDQDGNVVSGARNVGVWNRYFMHGVATVSIRSGVTSKFYVGFEGSNAIDGLTKVGADYYFIREPYGEISVTSGGTVIRDIPLYRANATLTVSATTQRGSVKILPASPRADGAMYAALDNGSVSIPVPAGHYEVVYSGAGRIPERKLISISEGETKALSFDAPIADLSLETFVTAPGNPSGGVLCSAYAPGGFIVGDQEGEIGGTGLPIAITSSYNAWKVSCQSWSDATGKRYSGSATYVVPDPLPTSHVDTITVAMQQNGSIVSQSATASSDSPILVPVRDDTSLVAGSGTFPANKVVTVAVHNKAGAPETEEIVPTEVFKFAAKDQSDSTVTATKDVSFQLKLGGNQKVYAYHPTSGYTELQRTAGVNSRSGSISTSAAYSVVVPKDIFNEGVIVITGVNTDSETPTPTPSQPTPGTGSDTPVQTPTAPTQLKLSSKKDPKTRKFSLAISWKAPSGTVTSYRVQLVSAGTVKKTVSVPAGGASPKTSITKLVAGSYSVKVQALNQNAASASVSKSIKLK